MAMALIGDFFKKTSIHRGFPIAMFDYWREYVFLNPLKTHLLSLEPNNPPQKKGIFPFLNPLKTPLKKKHIKHQFRKTGS